VIRLFEEKGFAGQFAFAGSVSTSAIVRPRHSMDELRGVDASRCDAAWMRLGRVASPHRRVPLPLELQVV
jgi:hypothetical protein